MSSKIKLDQYYTPLRIAYDVVKKTKEVIGEENITEWLEPSAGTGIFLYFLPDDTLAYDIEPKHPKVVEADYLSLDLPYRRGRCVIGNPPFGTRNTMSVKFYNKSCELGDYIAFILPASQYNNNQQMYKFDLVYSEMLPLVKYSGRELLCSFNIYKRPSGGANNQAIDYSLKDVSVLEWRRGGNYTAPEEYDMGICGWGASCGKEIRHQGQFALENYIIIHNKELSHKIIAAMDVADWAKMYPNIATPRLAQWKIYKYLRDTIPDIK